MTDTRLRGEWLNNMRYDALSDTAWRVFTNAMMWCNENGTDGVIPTRYLRMTHPDGQQDDANTEIERAGLWAPTKDGYLFTDWDGALGQETAERVELNRENARRRQREKREKDKEKLAKALGKSTSPSFDPSHKTSRRDSRADVTGEATGVRRNRNRNKDQGPAVREATGNDDVNGTRPVLEWPVAEIPGGQAQEVLVETSTEPSPAPGLARCGSCENPLHSPESVAAGRCLRCVRSEVSHAS